MMDDLSACNKTSSVSLWRARAVATQDGLMGSGLPASIFDLGIGPKINAQWTIGLLTFFKIGSLKKDLEELQKSGREVPSSTVAPVHESGACMKVFVALCS